MSKSKFYRPVLILLLLLFSFYYTNKSVELIKESDPIMKQIKSTSKKYQQKAENAQIVGNKIIPGVVGKEIDYDESYTKMKKYGAYNEALTTLKEVEPTVSITDHYDKYIASGNMEKKSIALVFKLENNKNPIPITNILLEKNATATLFVDGLFLENNFDYIASLTTFELELLSYDNKYEEIYFNSALNYLSSITKTEPKYCYSDYDKKEVIELCEKLKLHTILPTIRIGNYPYREIKQKLSNAAIISFSITQSSIEELPLIIDYIKQKGYTLVTLDELINENSEK